ncbi:sensor histidine kinase [Phycicoccus sonneratiae]|uniref:histidine kinase n=1 Tax=Phycicoccus sonneratiae TaxID=2807628 RepID=A0ABS2CN80_9MICO|nr:histidine kinase [Phycicoccus sonneraticus]MBM6401332.1 sensor histidine kinase [Phycicoccus sonneraticus]
MPAPPPAPRLTWWGHTWRFGLAGLVGLVLWSASVLAADDPSTRFSELQTAWAAVVDPVLGLVAFGLTAFRRRWPVPVAVAVTLLSGVSAVAGGAWALALCTLATRRQVREIAPLALLSLLASLAFEGIYPSNQSLPLWVAALVAALVVAVVVAMGSSIGADRARVQSLRDRAETSEREQQARVAAARSAERTRIAREMHDVLAHRISLVAMHAGALSFRDDLPREQQAQVARTIEENAHLALRDLRDVLGVLRAELPDGSLDPERPQPGLADLPDLVAQTRAAGTRVTLEDRCPPDVPPTVGRTVYRVAQEALTNARKHAAGCPVTVSVEGTDGDAVVVEVANPVPVSARSAVPGSGLGLLGLEERVDLLGGRLTHGTERGRFVLRASIPWTA